MKKHRGMMRVEYLGKDYMISAGDTVTIQDVDTDETLCTIEALSATSIRVHKRDSFWTKK